MDTLTESQLSIGSSPTPVIPESQQATIREAIGILESRLRTTKAFTSPSDVKHFCQLHIAVAKDEQPSPWPTKPFVPLGPCCDTTNLIALP